MTQIYFVIQHMHVFQKQLNIGVWTLRNIWATFHYIFSLMLPNQPQFYSDHREGALGGEHPSSQTASTSPESPSLEELHLMISVTMLVLRNLNAKGAARVHVASASCTRYSLQCNASISLWIYRPMLCSAQYGPLYTQTTQCNTATKYTYRKINTISFEMKHQASSTSREPCLLAGRQ